MIKLPTFQDESADFSYRVLLDSQSVRIRLTFNSRLGGYFILLEDPLGKLIGRAKVTLNFPLFRSHKGLTTFEGDFIVKKDDTQLDSEITYESLGNGHNLYFMTSAEVLDWEEANGLR